MDDGFEIAITHKGQEFSFPATLITSGYTYKIQVDIFGKLISFEPDEERHFRAIMFMEDMQESGKIDKELLGEIAKALETILK